MQQNRGGKGQTKTKNEPMKVRYTHHTKMTLPLVDLIWIKSTNHASNVHYVMNLQEHIINEVLF